MYRGGNSPKKFFFRILFLSKLDWAVFYYQYFWKHSLNGFFMVLTPETPSFRYVSTHPAHIFMANELRFSTYIFFVNTPEIDVRLPRWT